MTDPILTAAQLRAHADWDRLWAAWGSPSDRAAILAPEPTLTKPLPLMTANRSQA